LIQLLTVNRLSTYYVIVKAAGGNFDHMAAYFLLVMGEASSRKRWSTNLTMTASRMPTPLAPPEIQAQSSANDLQRYFQWTGTDLQRSTSRSSTWCWTALAHFMKGAPTQSEGISHA
jgi:hypothetical protein